jgi:hypothetical protein
MITTFPEFCNLDPAQRPELESITRLFEPYSDFNFTSLFAWNVDNTTQISILNQNIVIKLPDYLTGKTIYSLLGNSNIDDSLAQILEEVSALTLVPQVVVKAITNPTDFTIREAPEHFDYIYSLDDLAVLAGKKYRSKRKSISRFVRAFENTYEVKILDFNDPSALKNVDSTFERWAQEREKLDEDFVNEQTAIRKLSQSTHFLDLICLEIIIDGQVMGFSINEALDNNFAVCHFQKTILSYNGIDVYFTSEVAKELRVRGFSYVNWEQDLGLPGLKELKTSYKPVKMLQKYTISRVITS